MARRGVRRRLLWVLLAYYFIDFVRLLPSSLCGVAVILLWTMVPRFDGEGGASLRQNCTQSKVGGVMWGEGIFLYQVQYVPYDFFLVGE